MTYFLMAVYLAIGIYFSVRAENLEFALQEEKILSESRRRLIVDLLKERAA